MLKLRTFFRLRLLSIQGPPECVHRTFCVDDSGIIVVTLRCGSAKRQIVIHPRVPIRREVRAELERHGKEVRDEAFAAEFEWLTFTRLSQRLDLAWLMFDRGLARATQPRKENESAC